MTPQETPELARDAMASLAAPAGSAKYHHCGGCGRRLKIHRKEEVSGVALYVNGHRSCAGSSARVIEWLPPNDQGEAQPPATKL